MSEMGPAIAVVASKTTENLIDDGEIVVPSLAFYLKIGESSCHMVTLSSISGSCAVKYSFFLGPICFQDIVYWSTLTFETQFKGNQDYLSFKFSSIKIMVSGNVPKARESNLYARERVPFESPATH